MSRQGFSIKIEDNSKEVLNKLKTRKLSIYEQWGMTFQRLVTKVITRDKIVDTGELRRSMTYDPPTNKGVVVGTNKEYAIWVHEGTRKMRGRPFMKKAILNHKNSYKQVAIRILKE